MDHSKLHKPSNARRNADDHKAEKGRRRSIVQKQKRGEILERKRDLPPLRETTNIQKSRTGGDLRAKLEIWKKEREVKRRKDKMKSKPVFKVSSNIKREDNKFASSNVKAISKSKENQPTASTASNLQVEKKHGNPVARVTRSKAANSKVTGGGNKAPDKKKTVAIKTRPAKPNNKENKVEDKRTNGPKGGKSLIKEDKIDKENTQNQSDQNSQSEEKSPVRETVPNPVEEPQKIRNPSLRINSENDPLSESFAPTNFTFKAPAGLKKFNFSAIAPNSNESFIGGSVNFICSTPLTIPPPEKSKKTPVPMVLSSASGTSDDDNTNQAVSVSKSQNGNEDKEKEEKVQSFRDLVITESKVLTTNCEEWEEIQDNNKNILLEEVVGEIRTVIGQAQLLMAERFEQFSKLIDKYEKPSPDHNPVNPTDLKGFWEMIYYQVEDVKTKFKNLKTLQDNNWKKPQSTKKKVTRKRKASTAPKGSSAHRRAARKRIREAREAMKAKLQEEEKDTDDKEEQEPPAKSTKPMQPASKTISGDNISSQDDEGGPMTRSRRKTPGGKNVSFVTPRSKKRKARFSIELSDDEEKAKTPGSQPRKRVMRKTPLPGPRPDSTLDDVEGNTSSNEDVQASPSLKMNHSNELDAGSTDIVNQDEIKGVKLNFDDVESDSENNQNSIDMKYLLPAEDEENIVDKAETNNVEGIDMKYLMASDTDSPSSSLVSTLTAKEVCTDSPGRVLRSKRKSHQNPMSPFLKPSCLSNEVAQPANDLMSFSPLPNAKDATKAGSSQNANFIFPVRKSSRLLSRLDSLEYDSEGNRLDNDQRNPVGLIPSLL